MRGIVFNGEGAEVRNDVEVIDPGPNEVLVRLAAAGVCHSDVSLLDGTIPWPAPSLMGHEGAGHRRGGRFARHPGEAGRPRRHRHRLQLRHLRPVLGRQAHLVPQDPRQPARDLHRRRRAGRQLRRHVVVRGDDDRQGGAGGPDRQGGAAHLGLPHRLRRRHRHGVGVQPGQRAARRQRGRVRRRRRRPLHHPGPAHQGRQPHHRRRHRGGEGRARARNSAPRTSSTRPRPTRWRPSRSCSRSRPRCPRARSAPAASTGRSSASVTPRSPTQAVMCLEWGGVCVQVGVPTPGVTYSDTDHPPHPGRPRHHRQPRRRRARRSATSR